MCEEDLLQKIDSSDHPEINLSDPTCFDWKMELEQNFKEWIGDVQSQSDKEGSLPEEIEIPDIYSFYEELCLLRSESNKSSRRNFDAFARMSDTLESFSQVIAQLQEKLGEVPKEKEALVFSYRKSLILSMTELMSRFLRTQTALNFSSPRKPGFFNFKNIDTEWRERWQDLQSGFNILKFHLDELLKSEGVTRVATVGHLFDPAKMIAIAVENQPASEYAYLPPYTVIEEVSPGFAWNNDEVLRTAEVRILGSHIKTDLTQPQTQA